MIRHIFNLTSDLLLRFVSSRRALRYMLDRANGFQFGSYSLSDEAEFAASIVRENGLKRLLQLDSYHEGLECFQWQNIVACAPGVDPNLKIQSQ